MLRVECDRCGHILENYEYETVLNIRCKENNIDRNVHLCIDCARQFNEHFMKNKIGYRKDDDLKEQAEYIIKNIMQSLQCDRETAIDFCDGRKKGGIK